MPGVPRAGAWALRRLAWSVTAGGATTCPAACRRRPDAARSNSSRSLPFSPLRGPPSPVRANHRLPLTHSVDRGRADGMARRVSCHIGATASNVKPMTCANANGVPRVASIWHEMPIVGARPRPGAGAETPVAAVRWGDRWRWTAPRGSGGRVPEFGWSQLGVTEITLESGAGVGKVRLVMMACKWCAPMLSRNRVHLQFVTNRSRTSGDTVTSASLGTG